MASYDIEHNVQPLPPQTESPRRPDFSTFFSTLAHVDNSNTTNEHSLPLPSDVSAAFRSLAEGFERMRQYRSGEGPLDEMISSLIGDAERPPKEVHGVGQDFLDQLERIPKKKLKRDMDCPICGNPFLEDEYPLVVRLPCNSKHMFDLECIAPWLKLHATCPLDRKDLQKKKEPPPTDSKDEEDGEWDDMFA